MIRAVTVRMLGNWGGRVFTRLGSKFEYEKRVSDFRIVMTLAGLESETFRGH